MVYGPRHFGMKPKARNLFFPGQRGMRPANGMVLCVRFSFNTELLYRFELATESQLGAPGSTDTQFYYDTTLVLRDPDPELFKRFTRTGGIEASNPRTTDGGKTWIIDKVVIPPMAPNLVHKPG